MIADIDAERTKPRHTGSAPGWLTPGLSLWVSVVLWAVGIALSIAGVVLLVTNQATLAAHPDIGVYPGWLTSGLPYLILGGLIIARRPTNSIGWVLGGAGLVGVVSYAALQYAIYALLTRPGVLPLGGEAAWLAGWLWIGWIGFYPLFILLFPDGKPPSQRWRWVVWLDCLVVVALSLPSAIGFWTVGGVDLIQERNIPSWVTDSFNASFGPLFLVGFIVSLAAAAWRFRHAKSVERAQIRWVIYAVVLYIALTMVSSWLSSGVSAGNDATSLLSGSNLAFLILPVCIGVAIFRYHLFDIDRLINRTIVYGLLTLALGGLYFGGVVGLQTLLRPLTGEGNDFAVVAATLLVAALFLPLRSFIQRVIDRRFYRRKYHAATTLAQFGQVARDEVDLEVLAHKLVGVVEETMQPEHVSLWLSSRPITTKEAAQR